MNVLKILSLLILSACYSRAAISILIQPGQNVGTTLFTVTQISASPVLSVPDLSGYVSGMSMPTAMFNIPGLDSGYSSDIWGTLPNSLATVTESFSGQAFLLNQLRISADSSAPSLFGFDHLFILPDDASSLRFDVISSGPVEINIAYEALFPGVYTATDTLFGVVTVTVVPEPSTSAFMATAWIPLFIRKRRCRPGHD